MREHSEDFSDSHLKLKLPWIQTSNCADKMRGGEMMKTCFWLGLMILMFTPARYSMLRSVVGHDPDGDTTVYPAPHH